MSVTQKRIISLITAFTLLFCAAILPNARTAAYPFGVIKASAVEAAPKDVVYDFFSKTSGVSVASTTPVFTESSDWDFVSAGLPNFPLETQADIADNNQLDGSIDVIIGKGATQYEMHIVFYCTYPGLVIGASCNGVSVTAQLNGLMPTYVVSNIAVTTPAPQTITVNDGTASPTTAWAGDTVTITATPGVNQRFKQWTTTNSLSDLTATANPATFTMIGEAVTLNATFDTTYALTLTNCTATIGGVAATAAAEGDIVQLIPSVPAGHQFDSWTHAHTDATPSEVSIDANHTFTMGTKAVTITANTSAIPAAPAPEPTGSSPALSSPTSNSDSTATPPSRTYAPPASSSGAPSADSTSTAATTSTPATTATSAEQAEAESEVSEEGTVGVTIGNKKIETSSTSAAAAIVGGTAESVITSGTAVAVVTKNNEVIAGANASGSLNSASTVEALKSAAAEIPEGETEVSITAGSDVESISASTIKKLAEAAEAAGVTASIEATVVDETGTPAATLEIPVSATSKTSIKTGIILDDEAIGTAISEVEKTTGTKVLASFKTEQKSSFGTKVTFTFDTSALGLGEASEGDTYYIAIKRGDGKTVQVKGTIVDGKLVFSSTSAGTFMISDKSFTK